MKRNERIALIVVVIILVVIISLYAISPSKKISLSPGIINLGACPNNANSIYTNVGQQYSCACSSNQTKSGSIWGTYIYTYDSTLCMAAVHAGNIPISGGNVIFTIVPGQSNYTGSTKNGITSQSYGSWAGSYSFGSSSGSGGGGAGSNATLGIKYIDPTQCYSISSQTGDNVTLNSIKLSCSSNQVILETYGNCPQGSIPFGFGGEGLANSLPYTEVYICLSTTTGQTIKPVAASGYCCNIVTR